MSVNIHKLDKNSTKIFTESKNKVEWEECACSGVLADWQICTSNRLNGQLT